MCICMCNKRISGRTVSPRTSSVVAAQRRARRRTEGSQGPRMSPQNCALGSNSDMTVPRRREVRDVPIPGPATTRPGSSAVRMRGAPDSAAKSSEVWRTAGEAERRAASWTVRTLHPRSPAPPQRAPAPLDAWSGASARNQGLRMILFWI